MLRRAPLLAVGTLDSDGRPWTTLWGGETGMSQAIADGIVGIRTPVATKLDPVVELLIGKEADGEVIKHGGAGKPLSGLAIDLETRKRVKLSGKMIAGSLRELDEQDESPTTVARSPVMAQGLLQLAVKIDESLGNCPKYLNKKHITPARTCPRLLSQETPLTSEAVDLIRRSDLFFMSTTHPSSDMDTNHRGGSPGFVRVMSDERGATVIVYPEYSGNRLYQSLGNMLLSPGAGLCFPDLDTGDCLYISGTTQVLVGEEAANMLPRSNLAIKLTVTAARHVTSVLPLRGTAGEASPYNPTVRFLRSEKSQQADVVGAAVPNTATLLEQIKLSPTISRFRFALSNVVSYQAGQHITLDFSGHLDIGYSHMRDDDPRSLNDDFVRTFTVSSATRPPADPSGRIEGDGFEITIRRVGVVTGFLFDYESPLPLEVVVKSFGGSFAVTQEQQSESNVAFIAAGVGITPLMPSLNLVDPGRLKLLWALRVEDVGLANDLLRRHPRLALSLTLFVTGEIDVAKGLKTQLQQSDVDVRRRRMGQTDVEALIPSVERFYICTGVAQRTLLLQWLDGREVLYEDYDY